MELTTDEMTNVVAETTADALEMPVTEIPPLSDVMDFDALATLASATPTGSPDGVTVTFSYAGLDVLVYGGATVVVQACPRNREHLPRNLD